MKAVAAGMLVLATVAASPAAPLRMEFAGRWERVIGRFDGRFAGASSRSFHSGDALNIDFAGTGFRLYGVTGPTGGHAVVVLAHHPNQTVDFYAPEKHTHVLVYQSPPMPPGRHLAAVVVVPFHDPQARGTYTNIDAVQVLEP